jgi:hypothetical protein
LHLLPLEGEVHITTIQLIYPLLDLQPAIHQMDSQLLVYWDLMRNFALEPVTGEKINFVKYSFALSHVESWQARVWYCFREGRQILM